MFHGHSNPLIVRHAELGDEMLPWAIGLFALAVIAWGLPVLISRSKGPAVLGSTGARIAVGVLSVAVAVIALVQVYRIGDSGAKAAWSSNFCAQPYVGDTCPTT